VAWPLAARAQQLEQIRRIGVLMGAAVETDQQAGVAVFKEILHQLGWIDGHNVRVEVLWAGGDPVEARKDAEELVALPADVIMTNGQFALQTLLQATRSVPIVFTGTVDPVGSGFIDSLARPGGNATGFLLFEYALAPRNFSERTSWKKCSSATTRARCSPSNARKAAKSESHHSFGPNPR
jgi:putative ABC transport system substrate-binding protein